MLRRLYRTLTPLNRAKSSGGSDMMLSRVGDGRKLVAELGP